ncbi:MAG: response regulator [Burkholderiales bacterium]|nr:response regulator [Burkholderiales bacterium]
MARILIIEDEPEIRANLQRFLRLEGYEAIEAGDGRQGLAAARAERPDLILCDVRMPELDGFEVLAALRADPATAAIPFAFLTASADRDLRKLGLDLGAHDYLTKPFDLGALRELIARRLAER